MKLPTYSSRPNAAGHQDTMPVRYRWWVMALALAAFGLAFAGWLNESWFSRGDNPVWLNHYTEYAIILIFGLWRIRAEQNPYTRRRLLILVAVVTGLWWLTPWLLALSEPHVGYLLNGPIFPSLHTPGTLTFFLTLLLIFFFGRRVICGFGCPCVGIRETVGFPFRRFTLRSDRAWRLRHSKWFFFAWYVAVMIATQFPLNAWTTGLVGSFAAVVGLTYFGSFFFTPLTGNRFYCRYLCPFGATFGLVNHAGFYGIEMDREQCIDCRRCEQACDMGIPVWTQGKETGKVTGLEDCMGCARCVISCPTDALAIQDVRNLFRPALRQDASHLLKRQAKPLPRLEPTLRPAAVRINDWGETGQVLSMEAIKQHAERCLDCGVPGCRNACPLGNFIPDWLEAAARGDWQKAGDLAHATSPLPEVCGSICPQHRLCEGGCTRSRMEGAVTIGAVERGLVDQALNAGWLPPAPAPRSGHSAAVIGAGPAGLSCAERLNLHGVEVTVYDRSPMIGGLLQTGVPSFKLDKSLLVRRQALLEQVGIRFVLDTPADHTLMLRLLDTHDAVFLGLGAQRPRTIELPGQELAGVEPGIRWLEKVNSGERTTLRGKQVLVLGGGDTAMDCARSARRLGANVTVAYRGPEDGLRASPKEAALAREEGVSFLFEHQPQTCEGHVQVNSVCFSAPSGRQVVPADLVIMAMGQLPDPPPWLDSFGIATEADGRIQVDDQGQTTHPAIWAGGDNTHGPDLAVTAIAAGRKTAEGMLAAFNTSPRLLRRA